MGKFDIPGVTKTRFASIQDGEDWSQQIQKSAWFKSRLFINKMEIVIWIKLALHVLEYQIRSSKITNLFANDGKLENDAVETGSLKDFVMQAGSKAVSHRKDMKEADFEYQKDVIKEQTTNALNLMFIFYALKNGVKYSYLIINGLILAFILGILNYNYQRAQLHAEVNSMANADIAAAWYEPGQRTYESILNDCQQGEILQFDGEMKNDYRFSMTLCVDGETASGAYVYDNLSQINKNLPSPPEEDYSDDNEVEDDVQVVLNADYADDVDSPVFEEPISSEYTCAALMLKGKVKGDISTPGAKISVNLNEYDSKNKKTGSFKGNGTVDESGALYIEGKFKNHDGQKISFYMRLSRSVKVENFSEIINKLQARKAIRKVLHIHEKGKPYAIVVDKNKEMRMLKYIDAFTNYEYALQSAYPMYGTYNKDNVIVSDDVIIMRKPSESNNDFMDSDNTTESVKIVDLRGEAPKSILIRDVMWNNEKWEKGKNLYSIEQRLDTVVVTKYNQYGEKISEKELSIFGAAISSDGIISGNTYEANPNGQEVLMHKAFDLDGNEQPVEQLERPSWAEWQ